MPKKFGFGSLESVFSCRVVGCPRQWSLPAVLIIGSGRTTCFVCEEHKNLMSQGLVRWYGQTDPLKGGTTLIRTTGADPDTGGYIGGP